MGRFKLEFGLVGQILPFETCVEGRERSKDPSLCLSINGSDLVMDRLAQTCI